MEKKATREAVNERTYLDLTKCNTRPIYKIWMYLRLRPKIEIVKF